LFARKDATRDPQALQAMLVEGNHFYSLTRLPIEPFDLHLRVKSFLEAMNPLAHEVLAVLVNRTGDEFTLAWPKRASDEVHERVMTLFFANDQDRWTPTPYEEQRPSAICDPRVWFYENERPRLGAGSYGTRRMDCVVGGESIAGHEAPCAARGVAEGHGEVVDRQERRLSGRWCRSADARHVGGHVRRFGVVASGSPTVP
jgi:hypothetical protein